MKSTLALLAALIAVLAAVPGRAADKPITLLNVSYDPTRELYLDYNAVFAKHWKEKTGQDVTIKIGRASCRERV